uniref:Uncharacterized protein n=1 Tax=Rhizophora mucronata TaxID=61149 RepID=A0A2P2ILA4_RHIMU
MPHDVILHSILTCLCLHYYVSHVYEALSCIWGGKGHIHSVPDLYAEVGKIWDFIFFSFCPQGEGVL